MGPPLSKGAKQVAHLELCTEHGHLPPGRRQREEGTSEGNRVGTGLVWEMMQKSESVKASEMGRR